MCQNANLFSYDFSQFGTFSLQGFFTYLKKQSHGWLFNGTSTQKGQFVPTAGKKTGSVG